MPSLKMKLLSSLEKCFLDESLDDKKETNRFLMFSNERLSFQVGVYNECMERPRRSEVRLSGALAPYAEVRDVVNIPSLFPVDYNRIDDNYLRYTPGLYPDLLRPLHYEGCMVPAPRQLSSLWVSIRLPEGFAPGEYDLTLSIHTTVTSTTPDLMELGSVTASVRVLAAKLPEQKLIHTEWFYTDCIANAYKTEAFSEKHWRAIESFMRVAVDNGVNMILTPVFTPELDTYIGGERLTTQLVDIVVEEDGSYTFGFEKLDRWLDLCRKVGVKYYEIPHFFTQWGALHAPKFIAKVKGEETRIFGWETDAMGKEYGEFLGAFIPALLQKMKERGVDRQCFFHVSDEPTLEQLEHYKRCKELIGQHLVGYPIIDALSDYEFYSLGALEKPVPCTRRITPFLENHIEGLWAYYCGANGCKDVSNRYFSMSLARVRILGVQLWYYRIEGFLHWGYNFYNNRTSYDVVDPFHCSDGEFFAPSGDMYLVYPGDGEEAWESNRLNAMREAMDDIRALELCESMYGREFTERLVLEGTDGTLTFDHYPHDAEYLLNLRRKIALAVEEA